MIPFPVRTFRTLAITFFALLFAGSCATTRQDAATGQAGPESAIQMESVYEIERPVANPIDGEIPRAFYRAVDTGSRTMGGAPGKNYWQQRADYDIDVRLDTEKSTVYGRGTITYHNNSPDTLNQLLLELAQNVHKEGVVRNESSEVTGGMQIRNVTLEGDSLSTIERRGQSGYVVEGTIMAILPSEPVHPGDSVRIGLNWDFPVPRHGAGGRMGYSGDGVYFIAYWYPKMQVYDDVNGWFADPFRINAEFYHGFGSYRVDVTAPQHWMVAATGNLQNTDEVLREPIARRLEQAHQSEVTRNVVGAEDHGKITRPTDDGLVTWKFKASNVRDFAFSASDSLIWDAARTPVGDRDDDGVTDYTYIDAFYHSTAPLWRDAVAYSQHSISFLSESTGLPYPWPHMTAVEGSGIIGNTGGMEFPMMTLIGAYNRAGSQSLYAVIAHELAHMWVPMQVSTNERRYSWMDEGTTTYNESQAKLDYFQQGPDFEQQDFRSYYRIAGSDLEGPIMRWSDFHYNGFAYGVASYPKPASLLTTLRGLLGKETFEKTYHTFLENWRYKHPYPWDLFNTFENVSGQNLDWFWRSWYYETWTLDHAVAEVSDVEEDGANRIIIRDQGRAPMPAKVKITFADGETMEHTIGVQTWLKGARSVILTVNKPKKITRVEIDPEYLFPDVNRSNNSWEKQ